MDDYRAAEMAALMAQNLSVEDAGRMAGVKTSSKAWDTYAELTRRGAAAGNQVLAAAWGISPLDIMKAFVDGLQATKMVQTVGATREAGAVYTEVEDTETRMLAARSLAAYTGMDPGKKLEVTTTQQSFGINLNIDVHELLKTGSMKEMTKLLQSEAGLAD